MNAQTTSKKDKGFTLVELLIVIVILGILATVTVFAVRGITNSGKESACASDKKVLETAAESYMAQEGTYPADIATLESEHPGAPARVNVVQDVARPRDYPVLLRGEASNKGDVVPRRFLESVSNHLQSVLA